MWNCVKLIYNAEYWLWNGVRGECEVNMHDCEQGTEQERGMWSENEIQQLVEIRVNAIINITIRKVNKAKVGRREGQVIGTREERISKTGNWINEWMNEWTNEWTLR